MAFRKKTVYMKYEFEYESPDGEVYDCAIIQHGDRRYIQWATVQEAKEGDTATPGNSVSDCITIDWDMFDNLYKCAQEIAGRKNTEIGSGGRSRRRGLRPRVTDHRGGTTQSETIQRSVKDSMKNFDDDVQPVQSFIPPPGEDIYDSDERVAEMRSGVSVDSATQPVPSTPPEYSLSNPELKPWQEDVIERKERGRHEPPEDRKVKKRARSVQASDII